MIDLSIPEVAVLKRLEEIKLQILLNFISNYGLPHFASYSFLVVTTIEPERQLFFFRL
jgi:hypothetical protein